MVWESIMLLILFSSLLIIPINACIREERSHEAQVAELFTSFLQIACIGDIIVRNFTARPERETKEVILVHREIVW